MKIGIDLCRYPMILVRLVEVFEVDRNNVP